MFDRKRCFALVTSILLIAPAHADDELSSYAVSEIRASLASVGCEPGEIEFDDGFYEVQGARCERGDWNITLDQAFTIVARDRDD